MGGFDRQDKAQIGSKFEGIIASRLLHNGYDVLRCGQYYGILDSGIDILAYKNSELRIIQCKHWSKTNRIELPVIYNFYGAVIWLYQEFLIDIDAKLEIVYTGDISTESKNAARILGIQLNRTSYDASEEYRIAPSIARNRDERIVSILTWLDGKGISASDPRNGMENGYPYYLRRMIQPTYRKIVERTKHYQNECEKLRGERDIKTQKLADAEKERKDLSDANDELKRKNENLSNLYTRLEDKHRMWMNEHKDMEEKYKQQKGELKDKKQECDVLHSEIARLQNENRKLHVEKTRELSEMKRANEKLTLENSEYQGIKSKYIGLLVENKALKTGLANISKERDDYKSKLLICEKERDDLQLRNQQLLDANAQLTSERFEQSKKKGKWWQR